MKESLVIDARMIRNSGIGTYLREHLVFLLSRDEYQISVIGKLEELKYLLKINSNIKIINCEYTIYGLKEQIYMPFLIPRCDWYWTPHYNIPILPIKAKKRIVTIHDVAHLALWKEFGFGIFHKIYSNVVLRFAVFLSHKIITVSRFSESEIRKYLKLSHKKSIEVIPLGVDLSRFEYVMNINRREIIFKKYDLPERYILFVGNVKPNKNLISLIKSYERVKKDLGTTKLLIVGHKGGFIAQDSEVFEYIETRDIRFDIHFTGFVEDEDLSEIYRNAEVFVFPSKYEGFGLPPLEAMATGCPTIVSRDASLPEVCKDAAYYFDNNTQYSLDHAITFVVNNNVIREQLKSKGLEHVKQYSWDKTCKRFAMFLKKSM